MGTPHVWRAAAKQQAVAAGKMKECLEKSGWEDVFLPRDFAFLPVMLGTRGKANSNVHLQEVPHSQALKEEMDCWLEGYPLFSKCICLFLAFL